MPTRPGLRTVVLNSDGETSAFSVDRFTGHLVRRGMSAERAIRHGEDVTKILMAIPAGTVTTDLLRHVADELQDPAANFADVVLQLSQRLKQTRGALMDHRVRMALNYAVDRSAVMAVLGREIPHDWADPFLYNPEYAVRLLKEAGYDAGLELRVVTPAPELAESKAFALVMRQLRKVGVKFEVTTQPWSSWITQAHLGLVDGHTLFYAGSGIFLAHLDLRQSGASMSELAVRTLLRDLIEALGNAGPSSVARLVFASSPVSVVPASAPPIQRSPTDRRRMQVWMWEDGWESLVCLVAWWPAVTTASRTNYADSIDDLITDTLNDAVDEGACFGELEIMSHGNTGFIRMGDDNISLSDFDASGNPIRQKTKDLLDALKAAMCPAGYLKFTACNQGNGDLLRKISAYLNNAVTVSGYSGTGYPDLVPGGDVVEQDLHFQNGSTASGPP